MRVLRGCVLVGALVASAVGFSGPAGAKTTETTNAGAEQRFVRSPVQGSAPQGVPGAAHIGGAKPASNGIAYHGGPVLTSGSNVYLIWYGDWSTDTATTILPALVRGLSGSLYFNINTTYYDAAGNKVQNAVALGLGGQTFVGYPQGATNLSDSQINAIVANAITTNALPSDPNGVYYVLTSVDVTKSGFLTSYCGWHTYATIGGANIKYSFVGDPGTNPACSVQTSVSPNGNPGADAMASVLVHELEETTTDPNLNAWFDNRGYENADKCAWTFGTTYQVSNGSKANMNLVDPTTSTHRNYLIQRNWVDASGGYCSLSY